MHALWHQYVDGAGKWRGHRRHEKRETPVIEFLDDESGNEGIFDLDERRLPDVLFALIGHSLGEASKKRVPRDSLEQRFLDSFPRRLPRPGADSDADQEADESIRSRSDRTFSGGIHSGSAEAIGRTTSTKEPAALSKSKMSS